MSSTTRAQFDRLSETEQALYTAWQKTPPGQERYRLETAIRETQAQILRLRPAMIAELAA
jgi:hypothetical protein